MLSIEAFSNLLQVLYSAPLQQEQWQRFLTSVCEYTGSNLGVFISADTRTGLSVLASGGQHGESATILDYNRQFAQKDPFRPAIVRRCRSRNPVGVYSEEELVPSQDFLQSQIYRGLLGPANLRYAAITILACTVRKLDAISLWRTPEEGPVDADSRRLLELLIPHVQTALEVRRVLGATEQRLAGAEAMANASPTATFLLTRQGGLQHWNSSAEALVRSGNGLALTNGCLAACDSEAHAALSKLFHDAALPAVSLSEPQPSHFLSLARPSGKRPLQLIATPLPETHRQRSRADLLLLVTDPEKPSNFPDDALRALYDLTPAETEIANGLLMGYSPEEIACLRRVSASTVRQQVKSMLDKTGTSRQSEMVRLLMTLPQAPAQAMQL
jgi:DNA-binding CsgD family transcriptional regulator/PAS domain-containing protein